MMTLNPIIRMLEEETLTLTLPERQPVAKTGFQTGLIPSQDPSETSLIENALLESLLNQMKDAFPLEQGRAPHRIGEFDFNHRNPPELSYQSKPRLLDLIT